MQNFPCRLRDLAPQTTALNTLRKDTKPETEIDELEIALVKINLCALIGSSESQMSFLPGNLRLVYTPVSQTDGVSGRHLLMMSLRAMILEPSGCILLCQPRWCWLKNGKKKRCVVIRKSISGSLIWRMARPTISNLTLGQSSMPITVQKSAKKITVERWVPELGKALRPTIWDVVRETERFSDSCLREMFSLLVGEKQLFTVTYNLTWPTGWMLHHYGQRPSNLSIMQVSIPAQIHYSNSWLMSWIMFVKI